MSAAVMWLAGTGDPLGPVDQDPDAIREAACRLVAADTVCSPPEPTPPPTPSGGASAFGALLELMMWVLFFAMVAALLFLAVRAFLMARAGGRRRRGAKGDRSDDDVELLPRVAIDRSREPAEWRREAEEHRRAGRYRDAVRCRYRALVGDLARHGLIDEIPGRTSGEERAQMSVVAPLQAPAFSAAAELFDEAWFGDLAVADADAGEMEALEGDVLARAGASTR